MKVIKRIEDLKRVYRLRNLILEKDEKIIIDYAKLLSNHIGLDKNLVDLAITASELPRPKERGFLTKAL